VPIWRRRVADHKRFPSRNTSVSDRISLPLPRRSVRANIGFAGSRCAVHRFPEAVITCSIDIQRPRRLFALQRSSIGILNGFGV
jgi:hypothetical protein